MTHFFPRVAVLVAAVTLSYVAWRFARFRKTPSPGWEKALLLAAVVGAGVATGLIVTFGGPSPVGRGSVFIGSGLLLSCLIFVISAAAAAATWRENRRRVAATQAAAAGLVPISLMGPESSRVFLAGAVLTLAGLICIFAARRPTWVASVMMVGLALLASGIWLLAAP